MHVSKELNMSTKKTRSGLTAIVGAALFIATGIAMISCDGTMPTAYEQDNVVIQAYLYAGAPVNDIRLWRLGKAMKDTTVQLMTFNMDDSMGFRLDTIDTIIRIYSTRMIDNANVTISGNGVSHSLVLNDSGSYEDQSGTLNITPGTTYRIDAIVDDRHVWAETTVPRKVDGLRLSSDTLKKDTTGDGCMMYGCEDKFNPYDPSSPDFDPEYQWPLATPDSLAILTVKWNNPTSESYLFRLMYYEDYSDYPIYKDPEFEMPVIEDPEDTTGQIPEKDPVDPSIPWDPYVPPEPQWVPYTTFTTHKDSMRFIAASYYEGYYNWNFDSLGYIIDRPGRYKIIICSTTRDYESMAWAAADSMNHDRWPRSPSNINNGVGYFSSFSFDSVYFDIVSPTGQ